MPAIVTITFSPCIDKTSSIPFLAPERKLRCSTPTLQPGGGGINVARAIHHLGGKATAIYPAGGYTGKVFTQLLETEGVSSCVIETRNETRENIIVFDEAANLQYRFCMPASMLSNEEWRGILVALEALEGIEFIVVSGSLPPNLPETVFREISLIAKKKRARLVIDTSGRALAHAVEEGVFLLKPNLSELAALAGKEFLAAEEIAPAARAVISSHHCEAILISMGSAGALLVTEKLEKYIVPPPVQRKSTVGAGDSMVAGMVWALKCGKDLEQAAIYGVACGTAATLQAGTALCRKEDAEKLALLIGMPANSINASLAGKLMDH